jgi:hypothetical protein
MWSHLAAAMPDLASFGRQRLEGRIAHLATVRPDGSPRVHPVSREQARLMGYRPQERHVLFELRIEEAMATLYEKGHAKRSKWEAV